MVVVHKKVIGQFTILTIAVGLSNYLTISNAQLLKINSLFGGGQVLKVQTTDDKNYQFGMQLNPEWTSQQRLPLTLEKGQLKHSAFSIIVRLIAVGYLIYWLYE